MELHRLDCADLLMLFRNGDASPLEALESYLGRAELAAGLGAYVAIDTAAARSAARESEQRYRRHEARALEGLTFAVKDLIDAEGLPATRGSAICRSRIAPADAEVVHRLRSAGAILIGKTQTHEFGWGLTSINRVMGTARNPWDPSRIAGGSSGGSAVAIATGSASFALGTDTAGSVRVPASFCGVVGFKPTWELIERTGVMPLAPSLDHVGLLTRTPDDAALVLAVAAPSVGASSTASRPRFGLALAGAPLEEEVREAALDAAETLAGDRSQIRELPALADPDAVAAFTTIQRAEALASHRRCGLYPDRLDSYGDDVRAHLQAAAAVTADELAEALLTRELLRARLRTVFAEVDAIIAPVAGVLPPPLSASPMSLRERILPFTVAANLIGAPSCMVRAGFSDGRLPLGVQLITAPGRDGISLAVAGELFRNTPILQAHEPHEEAWPERPGAAGAA